MNFFGLGPGEVILIGLIAMIVLGPEKLPEVAASAGKWIREFRRATDELTRQFADENPFTEIQRAFTLSDEPVAAPAEPPKPVAVEAAPAAAEPPPLVLSSPTTTVAAAPSQAKSSYFTGPAAPGLDAEWTYGVPWLSANPTGITLHTVLDDEWQHGVPTVIAPTEAAAAATPSESEVVTTTHEAGQEVEPAAALSEPEAAEPEGTAGVAVAAALDPIEPTATDHATTLATVAPDGPDRETIPSRAMDDPAPTENHRTASASETEDELGAPPEPVAVGGRDAKGKNSEDDQR